MTFPPQDWQYPQAPSPYTPPGPPAYPDQPTAIRRAVALMFTGAAISFVSAVVGGVGVFNALRSVAFFTSPVAPIGAFAILAGLVPCGLWLWMAWKTGAGREWARVVSTVFFGLMSLQFVPAVLMRSSGVTGIVTVAEWLAGCIALWLLYRHESSQFFAMARYARATRQYPPPGYGQRPPSH